MKPNLRFYDCIKSEGTADIQGCGNRRNRWIIIVFIKRRAGKSVDAQLELAKEPICLLLFMTGERMAYECN